MLCTSRGARSLGQAKLYSNHHSLLGNFSNPYFFLFQNFMSPSEIEIEEISEERIEELHTDEHDSDFEIDKKISFFKHSSTL